VLLLEFDKEMPIPVFEFAMLSVRVLPSEDHRKMPSKFEFAVLLARVLPLECSR
jgi:hypothetical protein